jgi:predicted amidohydrolase
MKVFCCQLDIVWENKIANYKRVSTLLASARPDPGSLVVLPEMFSTGFSMNVPGIQESEPSGTLTFLAQTARESGVCVVAGLVTAGADGRGRNQSVVISPEGREIRRYSKMQPFTLGTESDHYAAGTEVITFPWGGFTCAPFICYDLRFPELFRAAVLKGAQLFVVIANWPVMRAAHWVTLLQARAIENLAYVVGVNRAGSDPMHHYPGRSLVVNPQGEIIADAGVNEGIVSAEIDSETVVSWRREFPALEDMRKIKFSIGAA